jgi:hypothetical protein
MQKPKTVSTTGAERIATARELLVQTTALFDRAGIKVRPFVSSELPVFSKHSPENQEMLIEELKARHELFASAETERINVRDSRQMLWRSLRRGGWTPRSDVFDSIESEDTVEVYSIEMKQLFRNLQFFQYISYTLEEIHGGTWYEMVSRNEDVEKQLFAAAGKLISGEVKETIDVSHVPTHLVVETSSLEKRKMTLQMKVISPVYRGGEIVGIISVNRTRLCE